jgi:hypothetical protein
VPSRKRASQEEAVPPHTFRRITDPVVQRDIESYAPVEQPEARVVGELRKAMLAVADGILHVSIGEHPIHIGNRIDHIYFVNPGLGIERR